MKPLTPRQQEVFDLIKSKIDETGMPPTAPKLLKSWVFVRPMRLKNTSKRWLVNK